MSTKGALLVFAALLALLGLTVGGHFLHWGIWAAMLIAGLKAALIAIYFMHLKVSSNTARVAACSGLVFLAILMSLTLNDYAMREHREPPPYTSPGQSEMAVPPNLRAASQ